ncbi:hypothetical protein GQ457_06G019470 [Hibiscus cannabinus]
MSGLRLNLRKINLFGVNAEELMIKHWAEVIDCKMGVLPTEYLCLSLLNFEGLGLVDMLVKNRSLLNKWIWRYSVETNAQCRKVIESKYGVERDRLLPYHKCKRYMSWVWKNIAKPLMSPSDPFFSKIRFKLGDGCCINFWEDWWTQFPSLKVEFLRLFTVVTKKAGKVADFGTKVNGVWVWKIDLRRWLFEWELQLWDAFISSLDIAAINPRVHDTLSWTGDSDGVYTPSFFCRVVSSIGKDSFYIGAN